MMTAPGGVSARVALGVRHVSCTARGLAEQRCSLAQLGKVPCDKRNLSDTLGTRGRFRSATRESEPRGRRRGGRVHPQGLRPGPGAREPQPGATHLRPCPGASAISLRLGGTGCARVSPTLCLQSSWELNRTGPRASVLGPP